jgi:hypothetical protein
MAAGRDIKTCSPPMLFKAKPGAVSGDGPYPSEDIDPPGRLLGEGVESAGVVV